MQRRVAAGRTSPVAVAMAALPTLTSIIPELPLQDSSPVGVYCFNPSPRRASKAKIPSGEAIPGKSPGEDYEGQFQPLLKGSIIGIHCSLGRCNSDVSGICGLRRSYRGNHGRVKTVIYGG